MTDIEAYDCQIHREADALARIEQAWKALERRAAPEGPFTTFRWQRVWWNAYGQGRRPFIVTAFAGDELIALAPLYLENRLGVRTLQLMGEGRLDQLGLLFDPSHPEALEALGTALRRNSDWDVCRLDSWSLGPEVRTRFATGLGTRLNASRVYERCPLVEVSESWEGYLATFPSRFRKWLRKVERRSQEYEDLTSEHCVGDALSHAHVDELEDLDRRTRHRQQGTSHFADGRFGAMLRELLETPDSGLELWCVRSGGRLIAAELTMAWERRVLGLWTAFDADYDYVGTYAVLLALKDTFERKLDHFDFLQGDERYKMTWANAESAVDQAIHARMTPLGLAAYAATNARWRLARSERAQHWATEIRGRWSRLRARE